MNQTIREIIGTFLGVVAFVHLLFPSLSYYLYPFASLSSVSGTFYRWTMFTIIVVLSLMLLRNKKVESGVVKIKESKLCPVCNGKNLHTAQFCIKCGHKFFTRITATHIFFSLLVIAAIVFLPTKVVGYPVQVPYEELEEYTERVPYQTTDPYVESIPVRTQEPIRYIHELSACTISSIYQIGQSSVKVTNIDTQGATFNVQVGYIDGMGRFIYSTQSRYIGPGSSEIFAYSPTPTDWFPSCRYLVDQPIKIVTDYKDVTQTKEVTKYRDETKYRKVLKTKTETQYKEVNWLFGFDAIVKFRDLN